MKPIVDSQPFVTLTRPKPGGPTSQLVEDVAALIRSNDPHTAAKLAVRRVENHVAARSDVDRDCLTAALEAFCAAVDAMPGPRVTPALRRAYEDAVELLGDLPGGEAA